MKGHSQDISEQRVQQVRRHSAVDALVAHQFFENGIQRPRDIRAGRWYHSLLQYVCKYQHSSHSAVTKARLRLQVGSRELLITLCFTAIDAEEGIALSCCKDRYPEQQTLRIDVAAVATRETNQNTAVQYPA